MPPHIKILHYSIKESYEQINSAALLLKWIQNFHGTNFAVIHGSTKENENGIVKSLLSSKARFPTSVATDQGHPTRI